MMESVFVHGWGCSPNFWPRSSLGSFNLFYDRGYFGPSHEIREFQKKSSTKVLIAHSFGLHLAPTSLIEEADLVVVLSSFINFMERPSFERKKISILLKKMRQKISVDPLSSLNDFYSLCGYNNPFLDLNQLNVQLLENDLRLLEDNTLDVEILQKKTKVVIVHGANDQVVPIELGKALHHNIKNSLWIEKNNFNHAETMDLCQTGVLTVLQKLPPLMTKMPLSKKKQQKN